MVSSHLAPYQLMPKLLYICFLFVVPGFSSAQLVSGSYYGHADVDLSGMHNNYLTELVIKQKGTRVEGIFGYYFRDKYQSYFVHGRYDPQTHEITILNLPMTFYGSVSTANSVDCITNFRGIVIHSRVGSTVRGTFYHDEKYKYTCPDIKVTYDQDKTDNHVDSTISAGPVVARIWKPQADDFVVDAGKAAPPRTEAADPGAATADTSKAVAAAAAAPDRIAADTAKTVVSAPPPDPILEDKKKIEASFSERKPVVNQIFLVESDSVRLSFYDNGEIDGDSISVFVNSQVVLTHQALEAKAFNLYLHLDSTRDVNEVSMFAENLGRIPPNTALMVITDGKNRYQVFLSSSLTENATIQLKRKPQGSPAP
jgi:hypothetical protein